jgi:hypothetical protein
MMPIFVLRDNFSNKFKIRRADVPVEAAAKMLESNCSRPLSIFEVLQIEQDAVCEFMINRRIREHQLVSPCNDGWFLLDPISMLTIVRDIRQIFEEMETAREAVCRYANEPCAATIVEPTDEDRELVRQIKANRDEREFLAFECEILENRLKQRIGRTSGVRGLATWKTQVSRIYSEALFRESDPALYQQLLERYYCLDTKAWRKSRPDQYKEIQTTYFAPRTCRSLKLLALD